MFAKDRETRRKEREEMREHARTITPNDFTVRHYDTKDGKDRYRVDCPRLDGFFYVHKDGTVEPGDVTRPSRGPVWLRKAKRAVREYHTERARARQGYAYVITIGDDMGEHTFTTWDESEAELYRIEDDCVKEKYIIAYDTPFEHTV
jgi:MoaA/NifB/PqqE/SkfB family radical SAM enzyme